MGKIVKRLCLSAEKAHKTQSLLAKHIVSEDRLPKKIHFVAGVDVAYLRNIAIGATAVLEYDSLRLVESQTALWRTYVPYVPTLLSFREIPPALLSIEKLQVRPEIFLADGHGFAHPYRCGFASHLGLITGKPTIGIAKNLLFGQIESTKTKEDIALLKHETEVIGAVVTTTQGNKPVYVSVGHMISLDTAIKIVKKCTNNHRIPEPLRKAHEIANVEKLKIKN